VPLKFISFFKKEKKMDEEVLLPADVESLLEEQEADALSFLEEQKEADAQEVSPPTEVVKVPLWKQLGRKKPGPAPGAYAARMKAKAEREEQLKIQRIREEVKRELQQKNTGPFFNPMQPTQTLFTPQPTQTEATVPTQTVSISYEKIPLTQLKQMASIYNRAANELSSPKWNNRQQQVGRDTIAFVCALRDAYIEEVKQGQPS
jgi:hypothetical protein